MIFKIYFYSSIIWFIIMLLEGIIFRKQYIKARDKIRKATNDNSKIWNNTQTVIFYLIISFIPVVRFIILFCKVYAMIFPKDIIKSIKEHEKFVKEWEEKHNVRK